MKRILIPIMLLFSIGFCIAQVKSFDIKEVEDGEDIEDNIVLVNKTKTNIAVATLYGVNESNCTGNFNISEFISKNEDGSYIVSDIAEKIITFRGINAGKSQKQNIQKKYGTKLERKFRYFILYVEDPIDFDFSITDLKEKRSDLYIYITGYATNISEKQVGEKKENDKNVAEKKNQDKKEKSTKKTKEVITLKLGEYECSNSPDLKIKLTPLGTVSLKRGSKSLGVGTYEMSGNRLSISWTTLSKDGQTAINGKTMNANITDETSFNDGKTWIYVEK